MTDVFKKRVRCLSKGQVILEFTFCMIVIMLMIYGVTKVMIWTGRDFAGRSAAHDQTLYKHFNPDYGAIGEGPAEQIDPYFYTPVGMNAIFVGN